MGVFKDNTEAPSYIKNNLPCEEAENKNKFYFPTQPSLGENISSK